MCLINAADTAFLLVSAALVLLMTPALSVFYGGTGPQEKCLGNHHAKPGLYHFGQLLWIYVGYTLAFRPDIKGFIEGLKYLALRGVGQEPSPDYASTVPHIVFMIYQCMFAIITPALITGAFAERVRFKGFLLFTALWSLLVYSPVCHWIWGGGWLAQKGVLDFAGGLVVHLTCGVAALASAIVIGPRRGVPAGSFFAPQPTSYGYCHGASLVWFVQL